MQFLRQIFGWINVDNVSLHLFFFMRSSTYFPGGMEAVFLIGRVIPANGGAIVERWWIDDRGNPAWSRITTWVGQPPPRPGAGGPGERGENQV
jgi:hypothetical protein